MDTFTQYAVAGARMALEDSGVDLGRIDKDRLGIILGSRSGA